MNLSNSRDVKEKQLHDVQYFMYFDFSKCPQNEINKI